MTDHKVDLVTFKIRAEDRNWAEEEQLRLKRANDPVTQAELFERMRQAYEGTPDIPVLDKEARQIRDFIQKVECLPPSKHKTVMMYRVDDIRGIVKRGIPE